MDQYATLLDAVCLIGLGGWAYLVAKRKRRDEVGWALAAAAAFYLVGMTMEKLIAPKLGLPAEWLKPSGFLVGVLAGVVVNLALLFKKPMAPPSSGSGAQPPKTESPPDQEATPEEKPGDGGNDECRMTNDETKPKPEAAHAPSHSSSVIRHSSLATAPSPDGGLTLARFWPACIVIAMYVVTQFEPVTAWLKELGREVQATRQPFRAGGAPAAADTALNALDGLVARYRDGDTIRITGTDAGGEAVAATFTYGAARDGTTLGALRDALARAFSHARWRIDAAGRLVLAAENPGAARFSVALADGEADQGSLPWADHAFRVLNAGKNGLVPPYAPVREIALVPLLALQAWLLSRRLAMALLVALFVTAYIPALNWMEWRWGRGSDYYSHGYIIPIVVGALIWRLRGRLAALKPSDDLRVGGLALLAAGLFMLLVGAFLRAYSAQGISLVVVLCGIVFYLCGKAISKPLAFPLLFTFAMIPLPMQLIDESSFKLKMLASQASVKTVDLLHSLGLHPYIVIRDGSYIRWEAGKAVLDRVKARQAEARAELARTEDQLRSQPGPAAALLDGSSLEEVLRTHGEGDLERLGIPPPVLARVQFVLGQVREMDEIVGTQMDKIIIGDVCSGLRSLIALIAFGALFAYVTKLSLPSKLILFAAGIPISVLSNTWRVVTLNMVACHWGSLTTNPDGWVHDMTGYGIFAVAFVLYFSLERLLHWIEGPHRRPKGGGNGK